VAKVEVYDSYNSVGDVDARGYGDVAAQGGAKETCGNMANSPAILPPSAFRELERWS
jgi:hypothetical protein